jgi:outer membrane protein OmpA-like peptidoglycan-associated protein
MKKLTLVLALLAAFTFTAKAQEFTPYPYIQLQGGASYDFGEADFAKLISPAAQFAVGYRFDEFWGARFAVNGWQAKHDSQDTGTIYGFQFVEPNLDLTLDWSSAIFGYRADRPVTVYSFVGAGAAIGLENQKANELAANEYFKALWQPVKFFGAIRPGLGLDIRLGDRVSLNLECDAHFLPEEFNSRICMSALGFDVHMAVLGGLKINFGGKPKKVKPVVEPDVPVVIPYQQPKKEEPKQEYKPETPKKEQPAEQPIYQGADVDIFFDLNKAVIRDDQINTLNRLVSFMRNTPDAKVKLDGYADKQTGNAEINQELSEQRVIAVRQYLVSRGIDQSRISTAAHGDKVQPFTGEKNRAVTCRIR